MADRGRPSKYKDEYAEQARKLCLLGATDADLADFFHVSEQTINAWKKAQPDFLDSLKAGKQFADAEVADRLYQRAMGYSHPEEKVFQNNGEIITHQTTKHYPPDPTSMIFWLKNRATKTWRDKPEDEGAKGTDLADALDKLADKLPG